MSDGPPATDRVELPEVLRHRNKSEVKRAYMRAEIGLSDALPELMLDHQMERLEALRYLGL